MVGVILDHLRLIFVGSAVVKSLFPSQVKGDESNELNINGTENSQVKCWGEVLLVGIVLYLYKYDSLLEKVFISGDLVICIYPQIRSVGQLGYQLLYM